MTYSKPIVISNKLCAYLQSEEYYEFYDEDSDSIEITQTTKCITIKNIFTNNIVDTIECPKCFDPQKGVMAFDKQNNIIYILEESSKFYSVHLKTKKWKLLIQNVCQILGIYNHLNEMLVTSNNKLHLFGSEIVKINDLYEKWQLSVYEFDSEKQTFIVIQTYTDFHFSPYCLWRSSVLHRKEESLLLINLNRYMAGHKIEFATKLFKNGESEQIMITGACPLEITQSIICCRDNTILTFDVFHGYVVNHMLMKQTLYVQQSPNVHLLQCGRDDHAVLIEDKDAELITIEAICKLSEKNIVNNSVIPNEIIEIIAIYYSVENVMVFESGTQTVSVQSVDNIIIHKLLIE